MESTSQEGRQNHYLSSVPLQEEKTMVRPSFDLYACVVSDTVWNGLTSTEHRTLPSVPLRPLFLSGFVQISLLSRPHPLPKLASPTNLKGWTGDAIAHPSVLDVDLPDLNRLSGTDCWALQACKPPGTSLWILSRGVVPCMQTPPLERAR